MSNKYFVIGASGHAQVIVEILESMGASVVALYDANDSIKSLLDYPVLPQNELKSDRHTQYIIAIGNNAIRKKLATQLALNYSVAVHANATISKRSTIGAGTVVMAGVVVNVSVSIGKHSILNTNCSIDHECVIGEFVHISPNAALGGNVEVGEGTHIGIGACVKQGIKIGKWAVIGAGAVIVKDVPDYATVVGNPGKIIRIDSNK